MGSVRLARVGDLPYIKSLSRQESHALGFIPSPAYEAAITGIKTGKRWSNTCGDRLWVCEENGDLVGFLLASFGKSAKVNQICIQNDARKLERGKGLLLPLYSEAESRGIWDFSCGCADDLESNWFWLAVGWQPIGDRRGIGHQNTWRQKERGRKVNLYHFQKHSLLFPLEAIAL